MPAPVSAQLIESLTAGGAENLAVQIAGARAQAGDRAFLYVLTDDDDTLVGRVSPAVTVRRLHLDRAPIRRFGQFAGSVLGGYRRLARQLRDDGVQVVQSHLPGANFWALLLAERRVCAVAATIHNTREFDYGDVDHPLRRRLRQAAYRRILRRCDATIAVSTEVRDALLAQLSLAPQWPRRFEVVTNGVAIPAPLTAAEREAVRVRAGVPPGAPLVIAAGRLTEQKDFATLVAAAGLLRDDGPTPLVIIAGDGELRADLEQRVAAAGLADRVLLPGVLQDLGRHFLAADLFVLPSRWEGLPLVLLEAMACGLPVVTTRLEGLVELVETTGAGLAVPPQDPPALAAAIRTLLAAPDRRAACGVRARQVIADRYDFARVSDRLGRLYGELAGARKEP